MGGFSKQRNISFLHLLLFSCTFSNLLPNSATNTGFTGPTVANTYSACVGLSGLKERDSVKDCSVHIPPSRSTPQSRDSAAQLVARDKKQTEKNHPIKTPPPWENPTESIESPQEGRANTGHQCGPHRADPQQTYKPCTARTFFHSLSLFFTFQYHSSLFDV